ncbi:hypothetical protein [Dyella sp.]|uniref:hypothetical protein n=1 Tax=Dyella sp. TaxID=1869338 RepID=UPI002ED18CB3
MKFEALMMRSLLIAGLLVCALVMGAMVSASPDTVRLAANDGGKLLAPTVCAMHDGVVCPRADNNG